MVPELVVNRQSVYEDLAGDATLDKGGFEGREQP